MTDELVFNPPSIDPAQRASVFGTIQFIIDKMVMQEIDQMLPCKVVAVDRTTNRVSVQIMINMVTTTGKATARAQVASIPIYSPSAGGYVINFPVKSGDLGWVKATDTDISLFLQNLTQSPPNTNLLHKFDSAVYYPDNMNKAVTIAVEDADNLVIQKYDSTVRIALWTDKVKVTAPELLVVCPQVTVNATDVTVNTDTAEVIATGDVTVDADNVDVTAEGDASVTAATAEVTTSDTIELQAATSITLQAPQIVLNGALSSLSASAATFAGAINATGDVTGAGTSLHTHTHSGVQPGGGNTGPPV